MEYRRSLSYADVADTPALVAFSTDTVGLRMVTSMVGTPVGVLIADQLTSPHLALVGLPSDDAPRRFGEHGTKEKQVLFPRVLDGGQENGFLIGLDPRKAEILEIAINRVAISSTRMVKLSSAFERAPTGILRQSKGYLFVGDYADHLGFVIDTSTNATWWINVGMPFVRKDFERSVHRARMNEHEIAIAPRKRAIAVVYKHANRIDLVEPSHLRGVSVEGPRRPRISYQLNDSTGRLRWSEDNQLAYVAVSATDEHVFALYCGCADFSRFADEVHVLSWSGSLQEILKLDRPVYNIAVSEDGSRLFAATWTPREGIAEYRLDLEKYRQ